MIRRRLYIAVCLGLSLHCAAVSGQVRPTNDPPPPGVIHGTVVGRQGTGETPLAYAIISFQAGSRHYTATADSRGNYQIGNLSPGPWRIKAIHVGFSPVSASVHVPAGGTVLLDLSLSWDPILLPTLFVQAEPLQPPDPGDSPPPSELGELAIRALEGTSGMVEGGLAQVVRSLPGQDPSDPQDVLLMRGSSADLKLVLLDGAPIYTPFHMAGLVDSFDPETLGGATLFLGGAPAQFDGGLSYILDLRGRTPRKDRLTGSASIDLMTGHFLVEGPVSPSAGFLVSSRAIHNLGTPLLGQGDSPYGFGDLLARLEWTGDGSRRAYVTAFWNQESVNLDLPDAVTEVINQAPDAGNPGFPGGPPPAEDARWGNSALAAGLRGDFGDTRAEMKLALSRYESELPLGDTLPLFAESRSDRVRLTADFSRPWGDGTLRFGANLDRINSAYVAMSLDSARVGETTRLDLDGSSGGVYLEGIKALSQSVSLRGGGRLDRFRGDEGLRFAPRLSVMWTLTEGAILTLAAGRYHQFSNVASGELQRNAGRDLPGLSYLGPNPLALSVGTADHLVVSLDQILTPDLRLGLEGFVKEFSGVAGVGDQSLHASGVDLRVARDGRRAAGWLGYTLTWFWASDGIQYSGNSPFSGRHLLSAGLSATLTERTGLKLRGSYGDGLPFTSVPVFDEVISSQNLDNGESLPVAGDKLLNSAPDLAVGPDQGFLRIEVELFGRWSPQISGRTMDLRPYVRVLNALNRRDALFYHFDPWRSGGPIPLADLPLLPLVGLEWRF